MIQQNRSPLAGSAATLLLCFNGVVYTQIGRELVELEWHQLGEGSRRSAVSGRRDSDPKGAQIGNRRGVRIGTGRGGACSAQRRQRRHSCAVEPSLKCLIPGRVAGQAAPYSVGKNRRRRTATTARDAAALTGAVMDL